MLSLFAVDTSNRFVHISDVERGLACNCRCASCGESVVARLGDVREHHFAHTSNADPCESNYESDLHRFAKQVILEAGGLVVPMTASVAQILGFSDPRSVSVLLACLDIREEVSIGSWRPDLLVTTTQGVGVAIEVAYSSFCDLTKCEAYEAMRLPALEINLRAFTPTTFDVTIVKRTVLEDISGKTWLWPGDTIPLACAEDQLTPSDAAATLQRQFLPEEIVTIRGRWVSIKELPSGDITVKAVRYDPDTVCAVRKVARANSGMYRADYHNWVIPRFRAAAAREHLRALQSPA